MNEKVLPITLGKPVGESNASLSSSIINPNATLISDSLNSILEKGDKPSGSQPPASQDQSGIPPENVSKPIDPAAQPPEAEPKGKGFEITVENPDLIYQAIEKGKSGLVGETLMSKPLKKVIVELFDNKDTFNLIAHINYESDFSMGNENFPKLNEGFYKALAQTGMDIKERDGRFIFKTPEGISFIVGRGNGMANISISTGVYFDYRDDIKQLIPGPAKQREVFDRTIQAFTKTLKKAVEIVYGSFKLPIPEETLVLHSPAQKINGNLDREGQSQVTPEVLRGKIEIEKPNVSFDDIGGQDAAKREIEGLAFALKNPELYKKWGTKPPKGIILHGPPGTGKTLMAKALASQADARFFHVEASDVASKWYGESAQIVKTIFEMAKGSGENTIIFFDEIDAIAPRREGAHEATQRVISTLLENIDGMESQNNVIVVASTNRIDSIDPSLIRAGRFDRWVEVPPPDEQGRREIFNIHIKKAETVAERSLFGEVQMDAIIQMTNNMVGADVAEIIRRTLEEKVRQEGRGQQPGPVTTEDLIKTLKNYEKTITTRRQIGFLKNE